MNCLSHRLTDEAMRTVPFPKGDWSSIPMSTIRILVHIDVKLEAGMGIIKTSDNYHSVEQAVLLHLSKNDWQLKPGRNQ
jgi:hypothetical protein